MDLFLILSFVASHNLDIYLLVDLVTMTTTNVSKYGSITIHTPSPAPSEVVPEKRRHMPWKLAIPLAVLTLVVLFMIATDRRTKDRNLESHVMASTKSSDDDDDSGGSQHLKQYFYDDQLVDHHDVHRHKTFTQRYYQKGDYFGGPGSPIFLIFGGEDPLENLLYPFVYDQLAQKFNAHTFALEHRFFGTSMPVQNGTNAELHQLLTPDQALRDAARFIQHKRRELGCSLHRSSRHYCPAITVGGSYPGFLSGLMRFAHADGKVVLVCCVSSSLVGRLPFICTHGLHSNYSILQWWILATRRRLRLIFMITMSRQLPIMKK